MKWIIKICNPCFFRGIMGTKKGKADIDMEYMKFDDAYVVRLDCGEEIVESLTKICDREKITLATIEGIGAADHAVIGLYNVGEQVYHKTELNGPMEITALTGNVSTMDGKTYLHIHINLCDEKMNVKAVISMSVGFRRRLKSQSAQSMDKWNVFMIRTVLD